MAIGVVMLVVFAVAAWVCFGIAATLASSVGGEYLYMTGEVPWESHPLYYSGIYAQTAFALLGGALAGAVLAASFIRPIRLRNYILPILALGIVAAATYYICWMIAPAAR